MAESLVFEIRLLYGTREGTLGASAIAVFSSHRTLQRVNLVAIQGGMRRKKLELWLSDTNEKVTILEADQVPIRSQAATIATSGVG